MKITGTTNYVEIDLENGYKIKADGEILIGGGFVVYRDTMKSWEKPHESENLTQQQINTIIEQIESLMNEKTIKIFFI